MQGKILGAGAIRGDDGKRYSFKLEEVKNLNGKSEEQLVGAVVDFEIENDEAKAIFITQSALLAGVNLDFANFDMKAINGSFISSDDINAVKFRAILGIVCGIFSVIPFVGWLFSIAGIVFMILAILSVCKLTQDKKLLIFYIASAVLLFFGALGVAYTYTALFFALAFGTIAGGVMFMFILGVLFIIAGLVLKFFYYKMLANVTNEPFFIYAFIALVVASLLQIPQNALFWLGYLVAIVAVVLEIIAWLKFKEIKAPEKGLEANMQ
ncbi:hypothetical protein CQA38_02265 [Campylobacter sp. MIT 12-5580]|uniref:hypothetical protein n=1 Tax=Campylobacter sp. MIT 12-5580 TaxID=2040651 RepID=UPI0010F9C5B6|nr:hypothetical protein [Campylobacter sp. MIT 12-5580]TKX29620.1 hypothetical protein CQA38_02265 [Campylobacter sp. MIT 12-5580]